MALNFDKRLQEEIARRDAALSRMKLSGAATTELIGNKFDEAKDQISHHFESTKSNIASRIESTKAGFSQKLGDLKSAMAPTNLVREHPWGAIFAALAAGLAIVPLLRKFFAPPKPPRTHIVSASPNQKIVVEVVGAQPHGSVGSHIWKPVIDAVMMGMPALAAFVSRYISGHNGTSEIGGTPESSAFGSQSTAEHFPASISRRTAQPPSES